MKKILFLNPDYHCSFFYRNELRKIGWKADIYVPPEYPEELLYDQPDYIYRAIKAPKLLKRIHRIIWQILFFLFVALRYKYHFYYGSIDLFSFGEKKISCLRNKKPSFRISLMLSKMFRRKIIYLPSGLPDEDVPDVVRKYGDDEEGVAVRDSREMKIRFDMIRRYVDINIGFGLYDSTQFEATHIQYKALDLNEFHPDISIPKHLRLPETNKLRILHGFMFGEERLKTFKGNIKGTRYLIDAVDRLVEEGYPLELMYFERVKSQDYKFIQAQASIVVEELIRGSWGSTGLETLALGKPTITFVRKEWEEFYYECFPDSKPVPFIIANKNTIYDVLKRTVTDKEFRSLKSTQSRQWAESNLNPESNVKQLVEILNRS